MSCATVGNEKLGSVTLPSNAHGHSGSMGVQTTKQHSLQPLVYLTLLAALATPHTVWAQATAAPPISGVIGKLDSFHRQLTRRSDTFGRGPRLCQAAPHNV